MVSGRRMGNASPAGAFPQGEARRPALAQNILSRAQKCLAQVAMVIALTLIFDVDTVTIPCHVITVNIVGVRRNTPKRRA